MSKKQTKSKESKIIGRQQVIKILAGFNLWRRGQIEDYPYTPIELGLAIESAIKYLEEGE